MKTKFIKNSSIFFITALFTSGLGFITLPIYTRYLSPSDYGILALFYLFGSVIVNLISVGLMSASYRYYFEYKNKQKSFQIFNTTSVVFNVVTFLFFGVFIYLFAAWLSNSVFDNKVSPKLLQLSYLSGCLNYFIQYFLNLISAQLKTFTFAFLSITRVIIDIIFSFYFIFHDSLTYMARINATIISGVIIFILSFFAVKNLFVWRLSLKHLKESLTFSYPNIPTTMIGLAYQSFDKVMIINYRNMSSLGHYNIGEKFAGIFKISTDAIVRVFNPFFQEKAHEKSLEAKKDIVRLYYNIAGIYLLGAFTIICFSEELIKLFTTKEFHQSIYLAPLFIFYYLFGAIMSTIAVNQIMFAKKLIFQLPVSIISIISNISLNIILIPRYGALGAVLATAVTALIADSLLLYFGQRAFPLPLDFRKMVKMFVVIIVFTAPIYYLMFSDIQMIQKITLKILILSIFFFSLIKLSIFSENKIVRIPNIFQN